MKKLIILVVALTALSGCTKNEVSRIVHDFVVDTRDWELVDTDTPSPFYAYSFYFPELSNHIYNNGSIVAYLETTYTDGSRRQQTLPYVQSRSVVVGDGYRDYIRTIDYDYTDNGDIAFYVTHSDFTYDGRPESMRFRVVMIW